MPLFCCIATLGMVLPNASACAMAGQGAHAGSASALLGSLQFAIAALAASLVGALHDGTARPMALVMLVCASGALLVAWRTAQYRPDIANPGVVEEGAG
ncbi:bicyclomycin/multidrug efflux system [compost metagenome]